MTDVFAVANFCDALGRALELEALAEVRDRLLDLLQIPDQLFGVHVEGVAGGASQCRVSLQLTDAGRNLAAALGARDVDRLVVDKALSHFVFSSVLQLGEEAESRGRVSGPATTSTTAEDAA